MLCNCCKTMLLACVPQLWFRRAVAAERKRTVGVDTDPAADGKVRNRVSIKVVAGIPLLLCAGKIERMANLLYPIINPQISGGMQRLFDF